MLCVCYKGNRALCVIQREHSTMYILEGTTHFLCVRGSHAVCVCVCVLEGREHCVFFIGNKALCVFQRNKCMWVQETIIFNRIIQTVIMHLHTHCLQQFFLALPTLLLLACETASGPDASKISKENYIVYNITIPDIKLCIQIYVHMLQAVAITVLAKWRRR